MKKCCCATFERALEWGTDREQEGPAITYIVEEYWIGTDITAICFCPWCGKKLE